VFEIDRSCLPTPLCCANIAPLVACQLVESSTGWDLAAALASFQIAMLEGIEVVFIVLSIGAGGAGLFPPASLGALAALLLVLALGLAIRRPFASIPENSLSAPGEAGAFQPVRVRWG
jgi:uncharacterized membrane protein